jgi:adenylate cyclase
VLRNKKFLKVVALVAVGLLSGVALVWTFLGTVWTVWDYQLLDFFYKPAVRFHHGPVSSPQVVYLHITDRTYHYFGKNILDRSDLARLNDALAQLGAEAVAYDIIFSRPSNALSDHRFTESIQNLGKVYLPIGFELSEQARPFKWEPGAAYQRLKSDFLKQPIEKGTARPFYATRAIMQLDDLSQAAVGSGHISAPSDADGVYRHAVMLAKVDSLYLPSLSLAMFLDYAHVALDEMVVDWGKEIRIPANEKNLLDQEVVIPIDQSGRAFIPYSNVWGQDFKQMDVHTLLESFEDENLRGNLLEFFEGKFVLIGDVSAGTTDLGQTPLEKEAPLIAMHAAVLNGLLSNSFYEKGSFCKTLSVIVLLGMLMGLSASLRFSWLLYVVGGATLVVITVLTWIKITNQVLVPVATIGGSSLFIFFGLVAGVQMATSKERAFIRNAFSRYVPEKVVDELLAKPELLQLGGEERIVTVLFSDLEGFTTISETMPPNELVKLLNHYLTEMTEIILAEGGIIDKFEGDAIMAEFGIPIPVPDHAERAVRAALNMQRRMRDLRPIWAQNGLPELRCRIGINTGTMVVGNMGSHQVFDYTVIGDAVNLAARLESANKGYNTELMISEFTHSQLTPHKFKTRFLDEIHVKGKSRSIKVFEVCDS